MQPEPAAKIQLVKINKDILFLKYEIRRPKKVTLSFPSEEPGGISLPEAYDPSSMQEKISVAILTSEEHRPATEIQQSSLTFGRTGNEASGSSCLLEDLDGNGSDDLLCEFEPFWKPHEKFIPIFRAGDTQAVLRGEWDNGERLIGKADIKVTVLKD